MLIKRVYALTLIVVVVMCFIFSDSVEAKFIEHNGKLLDIAEPGEAIPGQIVVIAKSARAEKEIYIIARSLGATVLDSTPQLRMYLLEFTGEPIALSALKELKEKYSADYDGFPNYKFSIPMPPDAGSARPEGGVNESGEVTPKHETNDSAYQWWLWKIKEPYSGTPAAATKHIAVIDTGVDYDHPDLMGKVISVWDYVDWDADAMDEMGHGTHVAGIAAAKANNARGIHGVSPNSKIYAYRVLNRYGSGSFYNVTKAILDAGDNANVFILNLSLGGYLQEGTPAYNTQRAAVQKVYNENKKIVCVAAGNEANFRLYAYAGQRYRPVPAYFPESFTVGATEELDNRVYFSNYDVGIAGGVLYNFYFVDIVAPGYNVLSTLPGDRYDKWSGTSMATPIIAGACARVWDNSPTQTNSWVQSKLQTTGKSLGMTRGFPVAEKRVDVARALGQNATGFQGKLINAENGLPVAKAKVEARIGSTVAATVYTNYAGYFTFSNLDSTKSYTLYAAKSGYLTRTLSSGTPTSGWIRDLSYAFPFIPSRASTPTDANWRIITLWYGTQPGLDFWYYRHYLGYSWFPYLYYNASGMEANAYLEDPDNIIYYWNNIGDLGTEPYHKYMYDSSLGEALECHVIQQPKEGTYQYWLRCDPVDQSGWGTMKYSPGVPYYPNYPIVYVYKGNVRMAAISSTTATQVGTGTKYWYVCDIVIDPEEGESVTVQNQIQDFAP